MEYKKCCFTGNRSHKLPWKENENDERCIKLKYEIEKEIVELINHGYDYFISGMAQGIDIYCAEIVLKLKIKFPHIRFECALPSKEQSYYWQEKDIARYNLILKQADSFVCLFEKHNKFCNQIRNKYMVNNSEFVLAIWNGEKSGGTWHTIKCAEIQHKTTKVICL